MKCLTKDHIRLLDLRVFPKDSYDDGYKYVLFIEDCFTRYLWTVPLKDKKGLTVFNAFKSVIDSSKRQPNRIFCDAGKEFFNQHFFSMFKFDKNKIMEKDENGNYINEIYSVFNPNKANMVERVIQTISNKLQKHFDFTGKQEWVKALPKITKEYNNSVHRSLGISPKKASESLN